VAIVLGHCTAGGAYIPGLSELRRHSCAGNGGIFLGGPPLVKAATGEVVTADESSAAPTSTTRISAPPTTRRQRGGGDLDRPRHRRDLDAAAEDPDRLGGAGAPYYDPSELYGVIPDDVKLQFDMREVIARMVRRRRSTSTSRINGTTLVCG